MEETERIKRDYENYKSNPTVAKNSLYTEYIRQVTEERQNLYKEIIASKYQHPGELLFMEAGAGAGANLSFFRSIGIKDGNIFANELLEDRVTELAANFPDANILPGDALKLRFKDKFDIVFQSTVFTSILNDDFKKLFAAKLLDMTKPGGIVLWYDFMFDNPRNNSVKGINRNEIRSLFAAAKKIDFYKVTLAPPIGRRFQKLYFILNCFPFLRTHTIAVIHK